MKLGFGEAANIIKQGKLIQSLQVVGMSYSLSFIEVIL